MLPTQVSHVFVALPLYVPPQPASIEALDRSQRCQQLRSSKQGPASMPKWLQVHSRAAAAGVEVASHYLLKDIERQVAHGCAPDAARLLSKHAADAPTSSTALQVYTDLAAAVLAAPESQRLPDAEAALQAALFSVYSRAAVWSLCPLCIRIMLHHLSLYALCSFARAVRPKHG